MKQLFENWRRYVSESEATRGGRSLPYSDQDHGSTIGGQSLDVSTPPPESEEEQIKIRPVVKVVDNIQVTPEMFIDLMRSLTKTSMTDDELRDTYKKITDSQKEAVRDSIQDLLRKNNMGIDRGRITFTGL